MTILKPATQDFVALMADRWWRLTHLYQIEDMQTGNVVPLEMREYQRKFLMERHHRNFVPKARKYGMSTIIVIDYLDACLFSPTNSPIHCAHVDFKDPDAVTKLAKAKLAWDRGPDHPDKVAADIWKALHMTNKLIRANDHELEWENGSSQEANTSVMGGNPLRLHVSEFGPLAAQLPRKAEKLVRGSFNAVPLSGFIDVETTMEGGPVGDCYSLFKEARENEGKTNLPPTSWKIFFIPWMAHPDNRLPGRVPSNPKTKEYFDGIKAKYKVEVPFDQQAWYEDVKKFQKWNMFTQHPTVLDECLEEGGSASFFDVPGLRYQRGWCTGLETQFAYGDLTLQGKADDFETRSVTWRNLERPVAPFVVWEPPLPSEKYLLFADFAVGKQSEGSDRERDTNAYGVLRAGRIHPITHEYRQPQIVAICQPDDRSITTETIRRILLLSIYYGDCCVMPEINNKDDIATRLIAAGVRNIWKQGMVGQDNAMQGTSKTEEVFGWITTGTATGGGTRGQMLDNMQAMTLQQKWIATFPWVVDQMAVFHINKSGKPEAAAGHHDDFCIGAAMGLFGLPQATEYKDRREKLVSDFRREVGKIFRDPRRV